MVTSERWTGGMRTVQLRCPRSVDQAVGAAGDALARQPGSSREQPGAGLLCRRR